MARQKTIGFINLLAMFLLFSCSSNKNNFSENNYFNKNYVYNDSLKVGIDFDKKTTFREVSSVNKKELKALLKNHKTLSPKNLFLVADSKENDTETYFFYQNIEASNDTKTNFKKVVNDSVNKTVFFEKHKDKRLVSGFVKSISKENKQSSTTFVNDLMNKISIDSLNQRKLSFISIFINYLPSVDPNFLYANKKLATAPLKANGENSDKFQFMATVNSFMSNNKVYDSLIVGYERERKEKYNSLIADLTKKEAVFKDKAVFEKVSQIAKENQVIMLNEDHYYPKHRLFAMQLLETLKANGYNYLSLEGFNIIDKDYIPNYKNGIYTDEPYFAHFIRKAKELGFTILGHENIDKNTVRELGQAKNIVKILEKDPKAKIFVYVGHGHLEKEGKDPKRMGEWFKELSGINPITINQVAICSDNKNDLLLLPRAVVNDSLRKESTVDYFVVNNLKPSLREIYPNAEFKNSKIKKEIFSAYKNKEVLVDIIDFNEYDLIKNMAIPVQNFLAVPKNDEINFDLPIGKYHVFIKTGDDKLIYDDNLIVN